MAGLADTAVCPSGYLCAIQLQLMIKRPLEQERAEEENLKEDTK